jgi:DNA-binding NarL/FixJ family response regulator
MITCIIIDDEVLGLDRMKQLLSGFPEIRVLSLEHIPELAIQSILRYRPDVVFLDVEMPRTSGFGIVEEVRSRNCHPEFIFITGFEQYAIKALKEGVFDYILKPVDVDELKAAIGRYKEKIREIKPKDKRQGLGVILSDREKEVLKLMMQGKTSTEIGETLFISKNTVDTHRRNILEKTESRNSTELISKALEKGWV